MRANAAEICLFIHPVRSEALVSKRGGLGCSQAFQKAHPDGVFSVGFKSELLRSNVIVGLYTVVLSCWN